MNIDREEEYVQFLYTMFTKIDTFITNFIISYTSSLGKYSQESITFSTSVSTHIHMHTHTSVIVPTLCMIIPSPAKGKTTNCDNQMPGDIQTKADMAPFNMCASHQCVLTVLGNVVCARHVEQLLQLQSGSSGFKIA